MILTFLFDLKGSLRSARMLAGAGLRRLGMGRRSRPWQAGLPPDLDPMLFRGIAATAVGGPVNATSYLHLSPFKAVGGAYRIRAATTNGRIWSVCFKDCRYDSAATPALQGHPATLGPPEHAVYARSTSELRQLLPVVYHSEVVSPGLHYRYVLEDVYPEYRKPIRDVEVVQAAGVLHRLQNALISWATSTEEQALIRYDRFFMRQLADHALISFEAHAKYPSIAPSAQLARMLELVAEPAFHEACEPVGVHGDCNSASILLEAGGSEGFRVIDWEWAGIGIPHLDLARLLERSKADVVNQALSCFAKQRPHMSLSDHTRLYQWSRMTMALLSAAILAADIAAGGPMPRIDRAAYLRGCLETAEAAYRTL